MTYKINGEVIKVPEFLQKWKVLRILPLQYLNSAHAQRHHRLQVFAEKGVKCSVPGCSREGAFIIERAQLNKKGEVISEHLDIFTKDFHLINVDHHISKSKGGKDKLNNKVPMCYKHNAKKSNMDPEVFYKQFTKQ